MVPTRGGSQGTEPLDALKEAIVAWRKCKDPRFALLAEWATARALPEPRPLVGDSGKKADAEKWLALYEKNDLLDVPRLLATVGSGKSALAIERLTLLSKRNDPRVVTGIFGWLEKPPYSARTAMPFFRTCAKLIADSGDRRAREGLEDLAARYKSIVATTVSDDFAAVFRRTANEIDQVKPGPLPAALEKKAQELEALFENERATTSRAKAAGKKQQQSDEQFLAAIYAAPDDDGPRLVFADTLTERGNLRGEFISLQLARAKGLATPDGLKRERELCKDQRNKAEWSLPLSQGSEARFTRGFPVSLMIDPRSLKNIVGLPALRTVNKVQGFDRDVPIKHTNAFLFSEHALHLKSAGTFERTLFDALTGPLNWEDVSLRFSPQPLDLERLPRLKRLELHVPWREQILTRELPALSRLESFCCWGPTPEAPEFWAPLSNLTSLSLRNTTDEARLVQTLSKLTRLEELSLDFCPSAAFATLRLPRVEKLHVRAQAGAPYALLLESFPALRELEFGSGGISARDIAPILALGPALSKLQRLTIGGYHFSQPFTPHGELVVRRWGMFGTEQPRIVGVLDAIPDGCVKRIVVRPHNEDPSTFAPPSPTAEQLASLKARVPIELEWY